MRNTQSTREAMSIRPGWIAQPLRIGLCCLFSLSCSQAAPAVQTQDPKPAVEFNLSSDQLALLAKRRAIHFLVGYFQAGQSNTPPLFTFEAPAAQVTPSGKGSARVPLQYWQAPAGLESVVVRIKTETAKGRSEWSAPSPAVETALLARLTPPAAATEGRGGKTGAKSAPKATSLSDKVPSQLRSNTNVRSAVEKRFPGIDVLEGASGYQTLPHFVAALCAASNLGIRFEELKPLTVGTGTKNSLEGAIRKLRPKVDAAAEAKKAQKEARTITRAAGGSGGTGKNKDRQKK